jgi:flavodoxin
MRVIYGTLGGTTRKVARRLATALGQVPCDDVRELQLSGVAISPTDLVICSPTYGDAELENGMEAFLLTQNWSPWEGCRFAICEVGIYTGYEDFGHGLCAPIRHLLMAAGMIECFEPLAVDSAPLADDGLVEAWASHLLRVMD